MTSRERVRAALDHRQPDKVPVDLGATPSSGISAIGYTKLMNYLGCRESKTWIYDVVQELAQVEEVFIDRFGIDVLDVGRTFNTQDNDWSPTVLSDGSRAFYPAWFKPVMHQGRLRVFDVEGDLIAEKPDGAAFFDQAVFPYLDGYPTDYRDLKKP